MATLSRRLIPNFLPAMGRRGEGQELGVGFHKLGQYFFLTILIWNGVNSQSKSNKLRYEKNKTRYDETEHHRGNIDPQK